MFASQQEGNPAQLSFATSLTQEFLWVLLSPCLAQVELTPCKHWPALSVPDWIHPNLTDLSHSGTTASKIKTPFNRLFIFINFIFFKLHKRTLFYSMIFFLLTYFTHLLLAGKFPLEIKLYSALILQELLQIPFCSGGLLSPQLWQVSNHQVTPLSSDRTWNQSLLHCSLSLLFKYLLPQLSLVSSTNSYRCWLIFSHQKSSIKFQCWRNFYIK